METLCLFIQGTSSGLSAVDNELGLLLSLAILKDSVRIIEEIVLDGILLDMWGILTIEKGNKSLLSKS